jgi:hypothetical protein
MQTRPRIKTKPKAKLDPKTLPPIRVRREPPTLDEAVAAAQGLTDDLRQQAEIAAGLMDIPEEEVMPLVAKAALPRRPGPRRETTLFDGTRVVVVERRGGTRPRPAGL